MKNANLRYIGPNYQDLKHRQLARGKIVSGINKEYKFVVEVNFWFDWDGEETHGYLQYSSLQELARDWEIVNRKSYQQRRNHE